MDNPLRRTKTCISYRRSTDLHEKGFREKRRLKKQQNASLLPSQCVCLFSAALSLSVLTLFLLSPCNSDVAAFMTPPQLSALSKPVPSNYSGFSESDPGPPSPSSFSTPFPILKPRATLHRHSLHLSLISLSGKCRLIPSLVLSQTRRARRRSRLLARQSSTSPRYPLLPNPSYFLGVHDAACFFPVLSASFSTSCDRDSRSRERSRMYRHWPTLQNSLRIPSQACSQPREDPTSASEAAAVRKGCVKEGR